MGTQIDERALEAACDAYYAAQGHWPWYKQWVRAAIRAYLAASQAEAGRAVVAWLHVDEEGYTASSVATKCSLPEGDYPLYLAPEPKAEAARPAMVPVSEELRTDDEAAP